MIKMTKRRLIVLDFDGTVTLADFDNDGTWGRTDKGVLDTDRVIATRFNRRGYCDKKDRGVFTVHDEKVWLDQSMQAWRECRLRREHIERIFVDNERHLRPGFVPFLRWLRTFVDEEGRPPVIAINSYGFVEIIDHILRTLDARDLVDEICAMEMVFDDDGNFVGYKPESIILADIKGQRTQALMDKYGITADHVIGIGDSDGDRHIVPEGGIKLLIAYTQKQVDKHGRHFHHHVISQDWSSAKDWLQPRLQAA